MIQEVAVLALGTSLSLAAWQDVKTREIDAKIFAAAAVPAAVLVWLNWQSPMYLFSVSVGIVLAVLTRLLGSGYADSIALVLIGAAPPIRFFPALFIVIIAGSFLLPATMIWLYLKNRNRPCKMTTLEKLTHLCVSQEEFLKSPYKFIVGEVKDLERYDPAKVKIGGWIKAKYGLPYLLYLATGYWAYVLLLVLG